jgi:membrane-associated phospholipid phosphatase
MNNSLRLFFLIYVPFLLWGIWMLITLDHGHAVLWFNDRHTAFWDFFFKYATYLGDGATVVVAVVLLAIFKKWRHAIVLGLSGLTVLVLSGLLKRVAFGGTPRPLKYFEDPSILNFVDGVKAHGSNAFPSGHTFAAFMLFLFLTLTFRKVPLTVLFFTLALAAGISRIYLLQHFLADVVAGSVLGILIALVFYLPFRNFLSKDFPKS